MRRLIITILAALLTVLLGTPAEASAVADSVTPTTTRSGLAWITEADRPALSAQVDAPQPQTWGWCGVITPEKKLIRMFKKKGGAQVPLYCGGPKYTVDPKWGLRHIMRSHMNDWQNKAAGTDKGWRELADVSIDAVLRDPDVAGRERHGKRCFSRHVYLWNYQEDRVVDFMTVKVVFRASGSRKIINAYPTDNNCNL